LQTAINNVLIEPAKGKDELVSNPVLDRGRPRLDSRLGFASN